MTHDFERRDVEFESEGDTCAAWLYEPDAEEPPAVVMAHGFGAERRFGLPEYAERFAARGMAVFVFDYRGFGDSGGEPRRIVSPKRHVADWLSAVEHVDSMDLGGVALWGTSFSGGHVVATAARTDVDVSALVAQVPFSDGRANTIHLIRSKGLVWGLRATVSGMRDLFRAATRRGPYYVPVVAEPDEFGVLNTPGALEGFEALVPEGETWDNRCGARIGVTVGTYRPISSASKVDCPAFVVLAEDDLIVPSASVEKLVDELGAEVLRLPVGHFDPYFGDTFETVVEAQADFLEGQLL